MYKYTHDGVTNVIGNCFLRITLTITRQFHMLVQSFHLLLMTDYLCLKAQLVTIVSANTLNKKQEISVSLNLKAL